MAFGNTTNITPDAVPLVSKEFKLQEDFGIINVTGWGEGDRALVEVYVGDECGGEWVPFAPSCCGQVCFAYPQTQLYLAVPNRYRFIFSNINDEHINDTSWFENLKVIAEKVSSNVDISAYLKGNENMGCGTQASLTNGPGDCTTITIAGNSSVICPGSNVSIIQPNDDNTIVTIDGQAYVIPHGDEVQCVQGGIEINGVFCQTGSVVSFVDNGDCTGTLTIDGVQHTVLIEEKDLHDPANVVSSDGVLSIATSGQAFDLTFEEENAAVQIAGNPDALEVLQLALDTSPTGPAGGDLTGTYPNPSVDWMGNAAEILSATQLKNCAGVLHAIGASIPTCVEMNAAIAASVAAIPGDKFLQGLQSYNATTNVLTLLMNDGSTVPVDMTGLVSDAVAEALQAITIVSADAGNLITTGTDGGALLTTVPAAPTSVTGTGCPIAAPTDPSTVYYIDISRDPQVAYFWDGASWTQLGDQSTGVAATNIYQYNSIETGPTAGADIFDSVVDLKIDLTPYGFDPCKHNAAWVYARSRRTYDKDTSSPVAPDGGRSSFIFVRDNALSGLRLDAGAITNSATAPGTAVDSLSESVGWVPVSDSGEITVSVFVNNHANMTADDRVVTDIDLLLQGFGYLGMARI